MISTNASDFSTWTAVNAVTIITNMFMVWTGLFKYQMSGISSMESCDVCNMAPNITLKYLKETLCTIPDWKCVRHWIVLMWLIPSICSPVLIMPRIIFKYHTHDSQSVPGLCLMDSWPLFQELHKWVAGLSGCVNTSPPSHTTIIIRSLHLSNRLHYVTPACPI